MIELTFAHGRTRDDARRRLETAVQSARAQFATLIHREEWAPDRERVKLEGPGMWGEISIDDRNVYAKGDIPFVGRLLGAPFASGLKQLLEQSFQKKLP